MKKNDFAVLPFNTTCVKDSYLVSNLLGGWDFLNTLEFRAFTSYSVKRDTPLFERLYKKGLLADENNLKNLIEGYRSLNTNLFSDTSLHIAVLTTRCNLACKYCQTHVSKAQDMNFDVALRVLKYLFDVTSPVVVLEFQGGEPLLNWDVLKFLVEHAKKFNTTDKDLRITLVTNLTLMDSAKMRFLKEHNVGICASLDGPKEVHDKNRFFKRNKGTYDVVLKNIRCFKTKFGKKIDLLPTITKHSLPHAKGIIDEYVELGQEEISLRPVNRIGIACENWMDLGYSIDEFCEFYKKAMDYILQLNKKGISFRERMATIISKKIFHKEDPGYTEMMNPCGAGRKTIVYMPNGDCYPCDEARMIGEDMFKLGNIAKENYRDLMNRENLLYLLEASTINLWDYNTAFLPWMGTCPVVNYAEQKNFIPKIRCSSLHSIYAFQFKYVFEKILEDKENLRIFKEWGGGKNEKGKRKKVQ